MNLNIAKGLKLSPDITTRVFGILARRGSGKSYTAMVMAEEMVKAGLPWVTLDPTGAWWGLRASANGKSEGLDVLVVGGAHGQLPLEEQSGKLMADLVVDHPAWYVFDLSFFESKTAERRFVTDFAERFFRRKAKSPSAVHLFVDEADIFVPQRIPSGDQRMLGAFEAIVRRGRIHGIGVSLISQRAAVVNKNVLEQIEVLIALRTSGPRDQKAIYEYVSSHGTDQQVDELMSSLSSLGTGEAWYWEPGDNIFKRIKVRERKTFDSSATATAGKPVIPAKLSEVDLDSLREQIASTVEKAKADDPKELRRTIFELRKEIEDAREAEPPPAPELEVVEVKVPFMPDETRGDLRSLIQRAEAVVEDLPKLITELKGHVDRGEALIGQPPPRPITDNSPDARRARGQEPIRTAPRRSTTPKPAPEVEPSGDLTGPQQRVIDALAWWEEIGFRQPSKIQVGFIAGYRVGKKVGGTYANILGQLRAMGLIDYPSGGHIEATNRTADYATPLDIEKTPEGLQAAVYERLSDPEVRVLDALVNVYPASLTKQEAGERAGYTVGEKVGGTFANILGRLRSLGLIDYPGNGRVIALPVLFLEQ